jgi:hypothetical protein
LFNDVKVVAFGKIGNIFYELHIVIFRCKGNTKAQGIVAAFARTGIHDTKIKKTGDCN